MPLFADYEPLKHGTSAPPGLSIRPATRDDLPALATIRAARDGIPEEEAAAVFARQFASADAGLAQVLVATLEGVPVAYGVAHRMALPGLPDGWYLGGVVVTPTHRRLGIAARLTRARLDWIAARAERAYYFTNERNRASVDLHAHFGFREVVRGLAVPGLTFTGGVGLLFGVDLPAAEKS